MIDSKSLKVAPELLWASLWIIHPPKAQFRQQQWFIFKKGSDDFPIEQKSQLGIKRSGLEMWPYSLLAVYPWAPYLTFMSLFSYLCNYSSNS